jgi:SAM-dependent methyltransferase
MSRAMSRLQPPKPTVKESILRLLYKASGNRPSMDTFFTHLLKHRRYLAVADPHFCIPRFAETEVRFRNCPLGAWSTPVVDVYVLIKAALGFESTRILELGSYRGETARLLAENTPATTRICTVDVHPDHGAAYKDTPLASRIDRKVGEIRPELFARDEKFDFIFVDAAHDYASVVNDTEVAFQLLTDQGVMLWHDYRFDGYFHGMAGVPEALKLFSAKYPIVSLSATTLALHSRHPLRETAAVLRQLPSQPLNPDVWKDTAVRG